MRGGTGSTTVDVIMTDGEFITQIEGDATTGVMVKIAFRTNKGMKLYIRWRKKLISYIGTQWGPYGNVSAATAFVWKDFGLRMGLLYFTGRMFVVQPTFRAHR